MNLFTNLIKTRERDILSLSQPYLAVLTTYREDGTDRKYAYVSLPVSLFP